MGNRYEGIWTIDNVLDVLTGETRSISIEPIEEGTGIEFILTLNNGAKEYHSVKRQTTQLVWSLNQLTAADKKSGRSILSDLFEKIAPSPERRGAFVSGTTANQLNELCEIACGAENLADFEQRLGKQSRLNALFNDDIVPLAANSGAAWACLHRLRVVGLTESELIKRVSQHIRFCIYRPDGAGTEPEAVRLALGEAIFDWLGKEVDAEIVRAYLSERGWKERDWQRDRTLHEQVVQRNRRYITTVEADLIHDAAIPRKEADETFLYLTQGAKNVAIIGTAGLGKSCVMAQAVRRLENTDIPHLTLRLDIQTSVLTSEALGKELGLPASPAIVLAGFAQGQRAVLIIDQLDALSLTSGRNQNLWDVFEELLDEIRRYPELRVLLACREFDAKNDHRIRRLVCDEGRYTKVELKPLDDGEVIAALQRAKIDSLRLTAKDLLLLRTPQNLSLFLQSGHSGHAEVGDVQTLLGRYWSHKQRRIETRLGRASRWLEVVKTLTAWLSEHQTLSAPIDILDAYMADAQAMSSDHVLVIDGASCRFFHESLFDYAFARTYVTQGGTARGLLKNDEQHLFRRSQVRQIFAYDRERLFDHYIIDLQSLLSDQYVRPHIKKLVMDWLQGLADPQWQEWEVIQKCRTVPVVSTWWRTIPHGSIGWFDLLLQRGIWAEWLHSKDASVVNQTLWQLGQLSILKDRAEKICELIEPLLNGTPLAGEHIKNLLRLGELHHSPRLFDLLLRAVREGWLDAAGDWWHSCHALPKKSAAMAAALLDEFIKRKCILNPTGNPFPAHTNENSFPADYCPQLAQTGYEEFIARILPVIACEVKNRKCPDQNDRDLIWQFTSLGNTYHFAESLLEALGKAAVNLAKASPQKYRALTADAQEPVSHTLGFILLQGWIANPASLADECAHYLSRDASRLRIGYDIVSNSGGDGPHYLTREAIRGIGPHCASDRYDLLEASILNFKSDFESPQTSGYTQLKLLRCLPEARLGAAAQHRLAELLRKFPTPEADLAPEPMKMRLVPSPISVDAIAKMNTENWISAMRTYHQDRSAIGLRGGAHQLALALKYQVQTDRTRYAKMLAELPGDIAPSYFDQILRGLVDNEKENGQQGDFHPASVEEIRLAVLRVHALPERAHAGSICHVIGRLAGRGVPDELLVLLSDYAINDPSPTEEDWMPSEKRGTPFWGGDPLSAGMNSGRGAAAWAMGSVLLAEPNCWPKIEATVRRLVEDESVAVRSCAIRCLLALLNLDRKLAVDLFVKLAEEKGEAALATAEVENFIHHGMYPHYPRLRLLLRRMLRHNDKHARVVAARQITVAAFDERYGSEDLKLAMEASPECRAACAEIFAANLRNALVGAVCRERLMELFEDPDKEVRAKAAEVFHSLEDTQLSNESELINCYIESTAFADGRSPLLYALHNSNAHLPDISCAILEKIVERQLAFHPNTNLSHDVFLLPELVLRLYRQTDDSSVRRRCLDVVDRMLEFGVGTVDAELGKVER